MWKPSTRLRYKSTLLQASHWSCCYSGIHVAGYCHVIRSGRQLSVSVVLVSSMMQDWWYRRRHHIQRHCIGRIALGRDIICIIKCFYIKTMIAITCQTGDDYTWVLSQVSCWSLLHFGTHHIRPHLLSAEAFQLSVRDARNGRCETDETALMVLAHGLRRSCSRIWFHWLYDCLQHLQLLHEWGR